jgi:2,4-diaminopentanoate dehydrogenase
LSKRDSPELLFGLMGFGRDLAPFQDFRADHLRSSFGPSLRLVADAVGLPLDDVTVRGELATTPRETDIAAGTLKVGSVAAQRVTVSGIREGHELITFRATWYCTTDLQPAWDLRDTGWHIAVHGDAPLDLEMRMPVPLEQMAETSPGYTANRAVNLVAAVCAAPPGIRSTLDLPHSVITLG